MALFWTVAHKRQNNIVLSKNPKTRPARRGSACFQANWAICRFNPSAFFMFFNLALSMFYVFIIFPHKFVLILFQSLTKRHALRTRNNFPFSPCLFVRVSFRSFFFFSSFKSSHVILFYF